MARLNRCELHSRMTKAFVRLVRNLTAIGLTDQAIGRILHVDRRAFAGWLIETKQAAVQRCLRRRTKPLLPIRELSQVVKDLVRLDIPLIDFLRECDVSVSTFHDAMRRTGLYEETKRIAGARDRQIRAAGSFYATPAMVARHLNLRPKTAERILWADPGYQRRQARKHQRIARRRVRIRQLRASGLTIPTIAHRYRGRLSERSIRAICHGVAMPLTVQSRLKREQQRRSVARWYDDSHLATLIAAYLNTSRQCVYDALATDSRSRNGALQRRIRRLFLERPWATLIARHLHYRVAIVRRLLSAIDLQRAA